MLLTRTSKAADVKKLMNDFFRDNMASSVCLDGPPMMMGSNSGFPALVKANASHIIVTHSILTWHAFATIAFPPNLTEIFKIEVECVNCV